MKIIKIQDLLNIKEYRTRRKVRLQDLAGKKVVLTGFTPKTSRKYGKAGYVIDLRCDGNDIQVFTCAAAVVEQLNALKVKISEIGDADIIGIACTVQKNGDSYYLDEFKKKEDDKENKDVCSCVQKT